uniref:Uncharacterized protein n=1 Tax=Aegilops tauschii subsp. strangulata TaxID=200361 RepID=A0A453PJW4_AEGTS
MKNRAKTGTIRAKPTPKIDIQGKAHPHRQHVDLQPDNAAPTLTENSEEQNQVKVGATEDRRTGHSQPVIVYHRALPPQLRLHSNKQTEAIPRTRRRRAVYRNHCRVADIAPTIIVTTKAWSPQRSSRAAAPTSTALSRLAHSTGIAFRGRCPDIPPLPSSSNAAQPSCPQPTLLRATARRPRTPHHIRGRRPDIKSDRPL